MRLIRWSYLLPRLLVAAAALLTIHFGTPPLVRWAIVQTLSTTTGADAQIGTIWTSLPRPMRIADVRVARNQHHPTNLVQFDSAKPVPRYQRPGSSTLGHQ